MSEMLICPRCKQESVQMISLRNEAGEHMHTWYVCTFWPSGVRPSGCVHTKPCGWSSWTCRQNNQNLPVDSLAEMCETAPNDREEAE